MARDKLTDLHIRKAKPKEKLYKLSDGAGLQIWVFPDGAKRWRLAYTFSGKQKLHAIGVYPAVSLEQARAAKAEAKAALDEGVEPGAAKKAKELAKASATAHTFNALADEILDKARRENKAERTLDKSEWLLSLARPALGPRPVAEITAAEVLAVLRTVEIARKA